MDSEGAENIWTTKLPDLFLVKTLKTQESFYIHSHMLLCVGLFQKKKKEKKMFCLWL